MRKIIVATWKMNPDSLEEASKIFSSVKKFCRPKKTAVQVILCPPNLYLLEAEIYSRLVGAQDVSIELKGAHTGEVNARMLKENGIDYVIVGHSERRAMGETSEIVNKKIHNALSEDLKVILCIGESERDEHGHYLNFLKAQIRDSLKRVGRKHLGSLLVAYEPLFTIGQKDFQAMLPHDIHQIVIFIRKHLIEHFSDRAAEKVPVLYGGSVSAENAKEIVKKGAVDGLLIGRQSLEPEKFGQIIKSIK